MRRSPGCIPDTTSKFFLATSLYVGISAAAMMNLPRGAYAQAPLTFNVTQRSYDAMRTGWNQQETTLNVANVGSSSFKQLAQVLKLDGQIDAQPLLVTGSRSPGKAAPTTSSTSRPKTIRCTRWTRRAVRYSRSAISEHRSPPPPS